MSSLNVKVLEKSFAGIKPYATQFASRFYYNLFTDNPQLEPLFANTNMQEQDKKLMMTLVLVIYNLRNFAYLKTILRDLGERHVRYATIEEHYPMVGTALLKTFEFYLGTDWTPEVKQAWTDAYAEIVKIMLEGMKSPEEALKLENELQPSSKIAIVNSVPTHPPAIASTLNDSEKTSKLEDVSQPKTNPARTSFAPTQPPATVSSLKAKLLPIIFVVAGLLSVGLVYYHSSSTERQEGVIPIQNSKFKIQN
ncbi:hypothetical protein NIES4073_71240 [Kalymmatonema gypsitolerans NIES-4073]|nr:hypothetical protein NIES4073_71240 [Scytonema sp. NIES-4073]